MRSPKVGLNEMLVVHQTQVREFVGERVRRRRRRMVVEEEEDERMGMGMEVEIGGEMGAGGRVASAGSGGVGM